MVKGNLLATGNNDQQWVFESTETADVYRIKNVMTQTYLTRINTNGVWSFTLEPEHPLPTVTNHSVPNQGWRISFHNNYVLIGRQDQQTSNLGIRSGAENTGSLFMDWNLDGYSGTANFDGWWEITTNMELASTIGIPTILRTRNGLYLQAGDAPVNPPIVGTLVKGNSAATGNNDQKWTFEATNVPDIYRIKNVMTQTYLTRIYENGVWSFSLQPEQPVSVWVNNSVPNQGWSLSRHNSYMLIGREDQYTSNLGIRSGAENTNSLFIDWNLDGYSGTADFDGWWEVTSTQEDAAKAGIPIILRTRNGLYLQAGDAPVNPPIISTLVNGSSTATENDDQKWIFEATNVSGIYRIKNVMTQTYLTRIYENGVWSFSLQPEQPLLPASLAAPNQGWQFSYFKGNYLIPPVNYLIVGSQDNSMRQLGINTYGNNVGDLMLGWNMDGQNGGIFDTNGCWVLNETEVAAAIAGVPTVLQTGDGMYLQAL